MMIVQLKETMLKDLNHILANSFWLNYFLWLLLGLFSFDNFLWHACCPNAISKWQQNDYIIY